MALRIRSDGRILCAATNPEEPGDIYWDDNVQYQLCVELKVLVPVISPKASYPWKNEAGQDCLEEYYVPCQPPYLSDLWPIWDNVNKQVVYVKEKSLAYDRRYTGYTD